MLAMMQICRKGQAKTTTTKEVRNCEQPFQS
jgi:hypothetical protein